MPSLSLPPPPDRPSTLPVHMNEAIIRSQEHDRQEYETAQEEREMDQALKGAARMLKQWGLS